MRKVSDNKKTKREAGMLAKTVAGTTAGMMTMAAVLAAVPVNVAADEVIMEWREENGVKYWYENGVRQGVKYNADGSIDISYRGKEIYDPSSAAWYWLDCVQNGAVAKNKDVYQESAAGQWGAGTNENGEKVGKWVRYDENGHMVKGWQTTDAGTYYFDPVYGTMAKGDVVIDGQSYYFNKDTGILERSGQTDDDGNSFLTDGWHKVGGVNYWYENGVRQGVKYNADGSIDISYRGKEIYDPSSNAWYWLDCVQNGAVAKNKDVYQESAAGQWGAGTNENGEKVGKWVRYDENGHMVKGWNEKDGNKYYFDPVYGTMAKGMISIDGKKYEFDSVTGKFIKEIAEQTEYSWVDAGQETYTVDGKLNNKKIVELDDAGHVIKSIHMVGNRYNSSLGMYYAENDDDVYVDYQYQYKYDEAGNLVQEEGDEYQKYSVDGDVYSSYLYYHKAADYENGDLKKETYTFYNNSGEVEKIEVNLYENGQVVNESFYYNHNGKMDETPRLVYRYKYTYDENENIIKRVNYIGDSEYPSDYTEYLYENGKIKESINYLYGYKSYKTVYEYDENGNLIKEAFYNVMDATPSMGYCKTYTYDKFGNQYCIKTYDYEQSSGYKQGYEYERKDGTVVKYVSYTKDANNEKTVNYYEVYDNEFQLPEVNEGEYYTAEHQTTLFNAKGNIMGYINRNYKCVAGKPEK